MGYLELITPFLSRSLYWVDSESAVTMKPPTLPTLDCPPIIMVASCPIIRLPRELLLDKVAL